MCDVSETSKTPYQPEALDRATMIVAGGVLLGAVMSILDTTIVNVAIDHLAQVFHASLTTIQWVITGYTLALATVILLIPVINALFFPVDPNESKVGFGLCCGTFLLAAGVYVLLSREYNPRWLSFASSFGTHSVNADRFS